jgi:hypothetical protein
MPKKPNPSIGTCPCPVCGAESDLKRFAVRAVIPSRSRRGGCLYVQCREHGALTSSSPAMQDWILDRADVWGAGGKPAPANEAALPAPVSRAVPELGAFESPDQPAKPKAHGGWGFFS